MYTQERADINGYSAWHVDEIDGKERWMLAYDQDWTEVIAEALVETTRERRIDMTGRNKSGYRFSVQTTIALTVRIGYRHDYKLSDPLHYYKGRKAAIREALRWLKTGHYKMITRMDIEDAARQAGATELELLNCWDENENRHLTNAMRLYEQYTKEPHQ
jgi:hypothetical protein